MSKRAADTGPKPPTAKEERSYWRERLDAFDAEPTDGLTTAQLIARMQQRNLLAWKVEGRKRGYRPNAGGDDARTNEIYTT